MVTGPWMDVIFCRVKFFMSAWSSVDFPTFGGPTMATMIGGGSSGVRSTNGICCFFVSKSWALLQKQREGVISSASPSIYNHIVYQPWWREPYNVIADGDEIVLSQGFDQSTDYYLWNRFWALATDWMAKALGLRWRASISWTCGSLAFFLSALRPVIIHDRHFLKNIFLFIMTF